MSAEPAQPLALASLPFFEGVPEASLAGLTARAEAVEARAGEILFQQGAPSAHTWFLVRGRVRLSAATAEGAEVALDHLGPGDCFGIVGVVGPMPRQSTAQALGRASLVRVPTEALQAVLGEHPELLHRVLRQLVRRLACSTREKVVLASQRVYGRLALKLLDLSQPGPGGRRLDEGLSHRELAALIGSTRATVTRALQELRRQGIIEEDEQGLWIRREEPLRELVDWDDLPAGGGRLVP